MQRKKKRKTISTEVELFRRDWMDKAKNVNEFADDSQSSEHEHTRRAGCTTVGETESARIMNDLRA